MKLRYLKNTLVLSGALFMCSAFSNAPISKATTADKQAGLTPVRALEMLKEGNQRFIENKMRDYNFAKEMKVTTKKGQNPLAIILSCIDSRSIPDFLFDQGLGNIFVSRIAGNVADKEILGSMEFATKVAGAKLVVVMGHTRCGAVRGACTLDGETGLKNLDYLLDKIKPAAKTFKSQDKAANCESYDTVDAIAKQNVIDQLKYIESSSAVLADLVKSGQIKLVGAMHDIRTGKVAFFDVNGESM
jgi:carbonic anhydrase